MLLLSFTIASPPSFCVSHISPIALGVHQNKQIPTPLRRWRYTSGFRYVHLRSLVPIRLVRLILHQNNQEAVVLAPTVTGRLFHPKDSDLILSLIAPKSCAAYAYWAKDKWIHTDGPIEIQDRITPLYLRLLDVTECMGGPRPKRRLSLATTPSPIRVRNDIES
jgi:hypothetical protein